MPKKNNLMKKNIIFLFIIFTSCNSTEKISNSEKEKITSELDTEIKKNNVEKSNYAMLEDRIAVNLNKKQRFGSQVTYNEMGQAIPKNGLLDTINIDSLRIKYNLPTFKEYYNWMTINHFEMNKEYLLKIGIKEPKLYK